MLSRLRRFWAVIHTPWQPGPEHRAAVQRVERQETRVKDIEQRRRDALQVRVDTVRHARD